MSTAPISTPSEPLLRIRPASRWQAINFREIWNFRDLITLLAGRDLKLRYRQTALGIIWVIMQPLIGAGVFAIVGIIAKTSTGRRRDSRSCSLASWGGRRSVRRC